MRLFLIFMFCYLSSVFALEHLSIDSFEKQIKNKNAIVYFYEDWCSACDTVDRNLKDFHTFKPTDMSIYKVDIKQQKLLAKKYEITQVPTTIYFEDGKVLHKDVSVKSLEEINTDVLLLYK